MWAALALRPPFFLYMPGPGGSVTTRGQQGSMINGHMEYLTVLIIFSVLHFLPLLQETCYVFFLLKNHERALVWLLQNGPLICSCITCILSSTSVHASIIALLHGPQRWSLIFLREEDPSFHVKAVLSSS